MKPWADAGFRWVDVNGTIIRGFGEEAIVAALK